MSGMAEVLHGLRVPRGGKPDGFMFIDANAAHAIADVLTASGFGPVKEAKATAWDEGMGSTVRAVRSGADYPLNPYRVAAVRGES